jgi:hypothetical protein
MCKRYFEAGFRLLQLHSALHHKRGDMGGEKIDWIKSRR